MGFIVKHVSVHDLRTLAVVNASKSRALNSSAPLGDEVSQELQLLGQSARWHALSSESFSSFHQLHHLHHMVIQFAHEARNHDFP